MIQLVNAQPTSYARRDSKPEIMIPPLTALSNEFSLELRRSAGVCLSNYANNDSARHNCTARTQLGTLLFSDNGFCLFK